LHRVWDQAWHVDGKGLAGDSCTTGLSSIQNCPRRLIDWFFPGLINFVIIGIRHKEGTGLCHFGWKKMAGPPH